MKLDGKVSVITGAASGLGQGIARRFVEAGGRVAICDIDRDRARSECPRARRSGVSRDHGRH